MAGFGSLSAEQVNLIVQDAYELLENVGLEIDHPELLKELAGHDGVSVKGNRVCYSPELAEEACRQVPLEDANYACTPLGQTDFEMVTPFSCFTVLDDQTGQVRPAEEADLVSGARYFDAIGAIGPVHVHLPKVDQRIAQVRMALLCCENSRQVGNWSAAFSYEQAMCIRDMYLAAGRPTPHVALQMTHSPLRLDAYFLDILMRARRSENGTRGLTAGGGAMPLPGVSSPLYWRCAAAQGLAECLGGWITVKLIDPAVRPYASFLTWAPDMSTCKWTLSTPEAFIFAICNQQVMQQALGLSMYADVGNLNNMVLQGLMGARRFACLGQRGEAFSLAHVPIDQEKVGFVASVLAERAFANQPHLCRRITEETFPTTSFLGHESTMDFRKLYWQPRLLEGLSPARAAELLLADSDQLLEQSRAVVARTLAEHHFALPDDIARQVRRIYDSGVKAILA